MSKKSNLDSPADACDKVRANESPKIMKKKLVNIFLAKILL